MPEKRKQNEKADKEHTHSEHTCRCNGKCRVCHCRPEIQTNEKI